MTRSLLSTSFLIAAFGSTVIACGDGNSTAAGGSGGTAGNGGSGASTNSTAGGGGTTTSTSTNGGNGGTGGSTTSTGGEGGAGGSTTSSTTTSSSTTSTTPNVDIDADQDGWKISDGDCCDSPSDTCSQTPELVNPGALEYPGNGVDDDCNPATLDTSPYPTCSTKMQADMDIANMAAVSSTKLVKALDLCVFTSENLPLSERVWGVIESKITLADGTEVNPPKNIQLGVLPSFGPNVLPQFGETMGALSTGTARREGDPGYVHPQKGFGAGQNGSFNAGTQCSAPPDYLAAHGGVLPNPCGNCVGATCDDAFDSVSLRIRIRPPSNAKSFTYSFNFFSAEYPEFVCDDFNDFFVALLKGNSNSAIPADGNIAFDSVGNAVSVNNAFFQVCFPAPGAPPGSCSGGTLELVGNGMGGWDGSITDGGGTGWLKNDVPMLLKPNVNNPNPPLNCDPVDPPAPQPDCVPVIETFELEFDIFDAGDHNVDSLILLDRFRWNLSPAQLTVHQ